MVFILKIHKDCEHTQVDDNTNSCLYDVNGLEIKQCVINEIATPAIDIDFGNGLI